MGISKEMKTLEELDDYDNPVDGSRLINCCFPDCGCDGSRLCQAEKGPSGASQSMNFERGTQFGIDAWLKNNNR